MQPKRFLQRSVRILLALLLALIVYLYIIFPNIEKDLRKAPKNMRTDLWQTSRPDSLGCYFIENGATPSVADFLAQTEDSIFVVNYRESHRSSVTLRDPEKFFVHFTNHYSVKTLNSYSAFLETGNGAYLKLFMKNAAWMRDHLTVLQDTAAVWTNDNMIYDKYKLSFGWPSAYAQGHGLSVLCRAFQSTRDSSYLAAAEKVLNSYNLDYRAGGILDVDSAGGYWYLEYPADPPAYVLNGFIYGLFGIYDYWRLTGSPKALRYFERGVATLAKNLHRYDKGYWSAYDLLYKQYCAGYNYHRNFHIPQLNVLYQLTGNPAFHEYEEKFRKYLGEPYFTVFKIKFSLDAVSRRFSYKNPIKQLSKEHLH